MIFKIRVFWKNTFKAIKPPGMISFGSEKNQISKHFIQKNVKHLESVAL